MSEYSYTRAFGIHPGWLVWDELSDEQREEVLKLERESMAKMTRKVHFNNTVYDIPEGMEYSIEEYVLPVPFLKIKYQKLFFSCMCGWKFEAPTSAKEIECQKCRKMMRVS